MQSVWVLMTRGKSSTRRGQGVVEEVEVVDATAPVVAAADEVATATGSACGRKNGAHVLSSRPSPRWLRAKRFVDDLDVEELRHMYQSPVHMCPCFLRFHSSNGCELEVIARAAQPKLKDALHRKKFGLK